MLCGWSDQRSVDEAGQRFYRMGSAEEAGGGLTDRIHQSEDWQLSDENWFSENQFHNYESTETCSALRKLVHE